MVGRHSEPPIIGTLCLFIIFSDEAGNDVVNPWSVSTTSATGVDYDKLIRESMFIL